MKRLARFRPFATLKRAVTCAQAWLFAHWLLLAIFWALLVLVPLLIGSYQWGYFTHDAETLCRKALAAQKRREWRKAQALYEHAIHHRPDWFVPHYGVAVLLRGYPEAWRSVYWKIESWMPAPLAQWARKQYYRAHNAYWRRRGEAKRKAHRLRSDAGAMFEVWKRSPLASAVFERGYKAWHRGQYAQAAAAFEEGLRLYPTYVRGIELLTRSYARLNRWEEAVQAMRRVPPAWWSTFFADLATDKWLLNALRQRCPKEMQNVRLTSYYLTLRGWLQGEEGRRNRLRAKWGIWGVFSLAARQGTVWVYDDTPRNMDKENPYCDWSRGRYSVWCFRCGRWRRFRTRVFPYFGVHITQDGRVWLCGHGHFDLAPLAVLKGNRFVNVAPPGAHEDAFEQTLLWRGEVWFEGWRGIYRHTRQGWWLYRWLNPDRWGGVGGHVSRLLWDAKLKGWFWTKVLPSSGLNCPEPLGVDKFGRLWCGERLFDGQKFVMPNKKLRAWRRRLVVDGNGRLVEPPKGFWSDVKWERDAPEAWEVRPNVIDRKGRAWIGTRGAGLVMWDGKHPRYFDERDGLSGKIVRCLELDGNTLWIGTDGGLSRIEVP